MNKKLTLKLLFLILLSFSLISCGPKDNISKSNNETQSSIKKQEGNINQKTDPNEEEEYYYKLIKEAKQRQQDYIDSIDDPKVKQSVQTSYSAAVAESSALYIKYPDDTDTIDAALKRVLSVE